MREYSEYKVWHESRVTNGWKLSMHYRGSRHRLKALFSSFALDFDEKQFAWFTWQPSEPRATLIFRLFLDVPGRPREPEANLTLWQVDFAHQKLGVAAWLEAVEESQGCTRLVFTITSDCEPFPIRASIEEFARGLMNRFPTEFNQLEIRTGLTYREILGLPTVGGEYSGTPESEQLATQMPTQETEASIRSAGVLHKGTAAEPAESGTAEQPTEEEAEEAPWTKIPDRLWHRRALELWWQGYQVPEIAGRLPVRQKTVRNVLTELRKTHGDAIVPTAEQLRRMKRR